MKDNIPREIIKKYKCISFVFCALLCFDHHLMLIDIYMKARNCAKGKNSNTINEEVMVLAFCMSSNLDCYL